MSGRQSEHRPLVSGIKVTSVSIKPGETHKSSGTLTGLAHKPNGDKVLVTNRHVASTSFQSDTLGTEVLYQEDIPTFSQIDPPSPERQAEMIAAKKVGHSPLLDRRACLQPDGDRPRWPDRYQHRERDGA